MQATSQFCITKAHADADATAMQAANRHDAVAQHTSCSHLHSGNWDSGLLGT